jgi:hypothetical protein
MKQRTRRKQMSFDTIIAYAYDANHWCPDCVRDVPESDNTEEGKYPIFESQKEEYQDENGLYCYNCHVEIVPREIKPLAFDWSDVHGVRHCSMKEGEMHLDDGFKLVARIDYDYDYDFTDGRGQFITWYQDGAIKNPRAKYDHSVCEYFLPDETLAKRIKDYQDLHYTLQSARKLAVRDLKEDMQIAADPESAGYMAVSVSVHVLFFIKHGDYSAWVELGRDSLHGIELSTSGDITEDEEIIDDIKECASNAITCAYGTVKALREVNTRCLEERI